MKKKIMVFVILLVVVLLGIGFALWNRERKEAEEADGIAQITFRVLGTLNGSVKEIDREKDIKAIVKHINGIRRGRVLEDRTKGWSVGITYYDEAGESVKVLSFRGGYMYVNGICYEVADDEIEKLKELYKELDYPEEKFGER